MRDTPLTAGDAPTAPEDDGTLAPERLATAVTPQSRRRRRFEVTAGRILFAIQVGFLLMWEVVSRLDIVDSTFISRPSLIVAAVPQMVTDGRVQSAVAATGSAMLQAFVYAVVAGVIAGYVLGFSRLLRDAFYGPALFLLSVPKSIFIPIFMVLVGINRGTAVYYGAFSAVIYVLINVVSGVDLVEERHLRVARAYGAGFWRRIADVIFPASLPGVFTGIWYGIKNALQGVLILELFISVGGLGSLIEFYTSQLRTDRVFAVVLAVSIVAVLLGEGWSRIERRLSRWRPAGAAVAVTEPAGHAAAP